jgi:hypothetical protein
VRCGGWKSARGVSLPPDARCLLPHSAAALARHMALAVYSGSVWRAATAGNLEEVLAACALGSRIALNLALFIAADKGHSHIVEALLTDSRADPAEFNSDALFRAACNGHTRVVQALLADGRADPAAPGRAVFSGAAVSGHTAVVSALLADRRADPARCASVSLRNAVLYSRLDIVQALLADGRADPDLVTLPAFRPCITWAVEGARRWRRRRGWIRASMAAALIHIPRVAVSGSA